MNVKVRLFRGVHLVEFSCLIEKYDYETQTSRLPWPVQTISRTTEFCSVHHGPVHLYFSAAHSISDHHRPVHLYFSTAHSISECNPCVQQGVPLLKCTVPMLTLQSTWCLLNLAGFKNSEHSPQGRLPSLTQWFACVLGGICTLKTEVSERVYWFGCVRLKTSEVFLPPSTIEVYGQ